MIPNNNLKSTSLALQGGGSHGAFTWGVLDRLLEDNHICIDGVSGTSSGAINAVVLAHGLACGGPEAARTALHQFWTGIAELSSLGAQAAHPLAAWRKTASPLPALKSYLDLYQVWSPYEMNPLGLNPIKDVLAPLVDFDRLRSKNAIRVFISATNVQTGKIRVFENHELSLDAVLASACLPSLHHAIEIDGQHYWDGGYAGNPPLFPLIFNVNCPDITVIMLEPLERKKVPTTVAGIRRRQQEISFNTAFLREMRAITLCKEQIEQSWFPGGKLERRLRQLRLHIIEANDMMQKLGAGSHYNTLPSFLGHLRDEGRQRAGIWLASNFDALGERSSVDLPGLFL
ncbi:MAG TPA: patatin-like phospholipase family protein [Gammaproteobacteria bacterium]|nr:patatin-like phospholipase family protein [Gammaproteobacteria bacterium]